MPETLNVNVLVAAKEEYTKQITTCLTPIVYAGILAIYKESQKMNIRLIVSLSNFQKSLRKVPEWTSFRLSDEVERTKKGCPYLMDLVTAIFVSHVKILACVRLKGDHKSIKIKIPSIESFLHKLYINVSEKLYCGVVEHPNIIENKTIIQGIISETVEETIRNQIPIESILNEYLSGVFDENDDNEEKNIAGNDIVSDAGSEISDISDVESEYNEEQKSVPVIPIERPLGNGAPDLDITKEDPDDIESDIGSDIESDNGSDDDEPTQQLTTPPSEIPSAPIPPAAPITLFPDI